MISEGVTGSRPQSRERGFTLSLSEYWHQTGLGAVLLLAAALNFLGLSKEGYGNTYYAAAVRSMSENWHAFFFNSLDPAGFVSLDKPPLGFWLQVASVKIFGYHGFALMLPQAVAGVLSVGLLYHLVGRVFGRAAGFVAALALALTPISVVAARNNIVDSTLVLAVLLGAWALTKAVQTGKLRWLLLCALFVGLGFNIKMLQAYLVVPAFGLMYLVGANTGWWRRLLHLSAAAIVLLAVSLSWVTAVDLTPASQRPWVGSTTTNSALDLAIGYNGLQRLTGNSGVGGRRAFGPTRGTGSSSSVSSTILRLTSTNSGNTAAASLGGPGGVGENGPYGPLRLLDTQLGPQVSWLLILAILGLFVTAWQTRRRGWTLDIRQSSLAMWGMWLLTCAIFFSVAGFYHTYYLVMVAPAIAALAGIGIVSLWQLYRKKGGRLWWLLPASLGATAATQVALLSSFPAWSRWLVPLIIAGCVLAAAILIVARSSPRLPARSALAAVVVGLAALLAAPATWSVTSVQAANTGITPRAGPGNAGGLPGGFGARQAGGTFRPPSGEFGGPPPGGAAGAPPGFQPSDGGPGRSEGFGPPGTTAVGRGGAGFAGGSSVNTKLLRYLERHQGKAVYLFATTNAGAAEPYIIATGKPVMAMGGFSGSDPILTSSKLASLVKQGVVQYFLLGGGGPGGEGNATSWVQSNCSLVPSSEYSSTTSTSTRFGSSALYDCG